MASESVFFSSYLIVMLSIQFCFIRLLRSVTVKACFFVACMDLVDWNYFLSNVDSLLNETIFFFFLSLTLVYFTSIKYQNFFKSRYIDKFFRFIICISLLLFFKFNLFENTNALNEKKIWKMLENYLIFVKSLIIVLSVLVILFFLFFLVGN